VAAHQKCQKCRPWHRSCVSWGDERTPSLLIEEGSRRSALSHPAAALASSSRPRGQRLLARWRRGARTNALRDPAWVDPARSHVPCGHSPAARCAGRRGGNGPVRWLAPAPAEDAGETVLGGLPSAAVGPSLLRPVPPPPAAGWPLASFRSIPTLPRDRTWEPTPTQPG